MEIFEAGFGELMGFVDGLKVLGVLSGAVCCSGENRKKNRYGVRE